MDNCDTCDSRLTDCACGLVSYCPACEHCLAECGAVADDTDLLTGLLD